MPSPLHSGGPRIGNPGQSHLPGDDERQLKFVDAVGEYSRLLDAYGKLGYPITVLPAVGVTERTTLTRTALRLR